MTFADGTVARLGKPTVAIVDLTSIMSSDGLSNVSGCQPGILLKGKNLMPIKTFKRTRLFYIPTTDYNDENDIADQR